MKLSACRTYGSLLSSRLGLGLRRVRVLRVGLLGSSLCGLGGSLGGLLLRLRVVRVVGVGLLLLLLGRALVRGLLLLGLLGGLLVLAVHSLIGLDGNVLGGLDGELAGVLDSLDGSLDGRWLSSGDLGRLLGVLGRFTHFE